MQTLRSDRLHAVFPLPPLRANRIEFGLDDLHEVRILVTVVASERGLSPRRASDLVTAASELAANSILHGGGLGLVTAWAGDDAVLVEVADAGTIDDPNVGKSCPAPFAEYGRGLYIADRLCDEMAIDSGPSGTRVRLRMATEIRQI